MGTVYIPEIRNPEVSGRDFNPLYVWLISLVAALGGLLFGYDWVVIGGAKPFYEVFFHLTRASQQGWAMSCALLGCLFGALSAGVLSDRLGRKLSLIISAVGFSVSSLATGLANTFDMFVFWRILGGASIGLASALSPMYISEIAPAGIRGRLVSLNQITIVLGMLSAQVANWLIARPMPFDLTAQEMLASWNGQIGWRWMFGVTAIPALVFLAAAFAIPESPRWLVKNGAGIKAHDILARIAGHNRADHEVREIEKSLGAEPCRDNWKLLVESKMFKPLSLAIGLAVLQQWCGVNVIFNYAQEVFLEAGYNLSSILLNIVITGAVLVVFTLVALATVDKLGRRFLMLAGLGGLSTVYILLGALYRVHYHGIAMMALILAAISFYAMSLAPVTWVIIAEVFPNRIRGNAISIAVASLWIACFVLTYTFPLLNRQLGAAGTFWIYAGICLAGFSFIFVALPETKGKSLEEIETSWIR